MLHWNLGGSVQDVGPHDDVDVNVDVDVVVDGNTVPVTILNHAGLCPFPRDSVYGRYLFRTRYNYLGAR